MIERPGSPPPERVHTIGALGEFPLIDRLTARLPACRGDTVVGAGPDDTAVLRLGDGRLQLATIDGQVAGVHFLIDATSPERIGRKAAAVNLSDIAAMGGRPTHAMLALSGPADLPVDFVERLVDGLASELARWGADLVGGNMSRHGTLVLDVALLGEVAPDALLLRRGARAGDALCVTGALGGAAAGLALVQAERAGRAVAVATEDRAAVLDRLEAPLPRLAVAPLLGPAGATAAIDLSDGLAADAGHLCAQSGVGVRVYAGRVPIDPAAVAVAEALGHDATDWALRGGEDYEILFTAPAETAPVLAAAVERETGVPVAVIGVMTAAPVRAVVWPDGRATPLSGGWRHFG